MSPLYNILAANPFCPKILTFQTFSLRKTPTLQLYPLEKRRRAVKNPTKGSLDDSWLELQHFWSPKLIEAMHNGAKLMMEAWTISKGICTGVMKHLKMIVNNIFCVCVCVFLCVCFHAVSNIRLEPT